MGKTIAPHKRNNVKRIRAMRGMTLRGLAAQSGVSLTTLVEIEQERRDPLLSTAILLARALGVSVEELAANKRKEPATGPAPSTRITG